ncbi:MAG TPA: ABC transporter permease [Clostridiales bacterium]|nr:MAG: Branched-chain amino acid transport system / permease component [Firmicutes bacterium ADurb.Bin262]HOU09356.1 ABC transporter permease [Clostridiales bacterium]HQH63626.1 ABC transporter permease [Clostridiales bacterium]HQK72348.1 ABC transporter permease [Clostridiales bacterium]
MIILADIIAATVLFAVPLLLVALGGMFSERSGVINIALEGTMIIGALFGCLFLNFADQGGWGKLHPQLAMLAAVAVAAASGIVYSLLLAVASVSLKADQTIGGTALNMLAPAFAIVLTWAIQGQGKTTIYIPNWIRITKATLGMAAAAGREKGFWETLFFKSMFLTTPIAFLLLAAAIVVMYKTRFGLRLRSCGEHPQAADAVGINVYKMRYSGVLISGFLAGIGGIAFTIAAGSGFQSTVAGYGFLALAVMIFGNWKPWRILGAAVFFAFFKVIGAYSGSLAFLPDFKGVGSSQYIYQMLPYIVTMIVLIFSSKKSRAPKAEGIPYDKGKR